MSKENKGLSSANEEMVLKVLDELKEKGTEKNIPAVLDLVVETDSEPIQKSALELLRNVKHKSAVTHIITAIEKSASKKKPLLVALCWEANLDCSDHLNYFIDLAVNEDMPVALEVLSLIENLTVPVSAESKKQAIESLKKSGGDSTKDFLIQEITKAVELL